MTTCLMHKQVEVWSVLLMVGFVKHETWIILLTVCGTEFNILKQLLNFASGYLNSPRIHSVSVRGGGIPGERPDLNYLW